MARLTIARRKDLSNDQFAGPDRSYPVPDASHARNALARVSQAVNAGRIPSGEAATIKAKARGVLSKTRVKKARGNGYA